MEQPNDFLNIEEVLSEYRFHQQAQLPQFPPAWNASFVLNPFGDSTPPMQNYNQLVLADISYFSSGGNRAMSVGLFLLEDNRYMEMLFRTSATGTSKWWWVITDGPGQGATGLYGPYDTDLKVPDQAFLQQAGYDGIYKGHWRAGLRAGNHFVVPSDPAAPGGGTWFMTNEDVQTVPMRIVNIGANNGLKLPVLGAYFIALSGGFSNLGAKDEAKIKAALDADTSGSPAYLNPMVTQKDIQRAMANPLHASTFSAQDVQSRVPGLEVTPDWPLPEWSHQVFIQGTTIGASLLPFPTWVYYDDQLPNPSAPRQPGRQLSRFVNFTVEGTGKTGQMQDDILYWDTTNIVEYTLESGDWVASCKAAGPPIGYPRRDFPKRFNSTVKGCIKGNATFGIAADNAMYFVVSAELPRPGPPPTASIFWWWFMQDQTGVMFSECELATPPRHALSVVDYSYFERDATWIGAGYFPDSSASLPTCSAETGKDKW